MLFFVFGFPFDAAKPKLLQRDKKIIQKLVT